MLNKEKQKLSKMDSGIVSNKCWVLNIAINISKSYLNFKVHVKVFYITNPRNVTWETTIKYPAYT